MPRNTLRIARCPYCPPRAGLIAIDADAVAKVFRVDRSTLRLRQRPEQKLILFDRPLGQTGPCPHLVVFVGKFGQANDLNPFRPAEAHWKDFFWTSADSDEASPTYKREYFWTEVIVRKNYRRFRPRSPFAHQTFERSWQQPGRGGRPGREHLVKGTACFALRATEFLAEFVAQEKCFCHWAIDHLDLDMSWSLRNTLFFRNPMMRQFPGRGGAAPVALTLRTAPVRGLPEEGRAPHENHEENTYE